MDMAAKGAYRLLQHHVCCDYKTSKGGNGMGGVHHKHNAHNCREKNGYPCYNLNYRPVEYCQNK